MGLNDLAQQINRGLKKNIIVKGNQAIDIPRFSWGSFALDVESGGGIPVGKIIGVIGEFSDGKTALVLKAAGEFQRKYPDKAVVWIDAEGAWSTHWAKTLGVNTKNIFLVRPEYAQQAFNIALQVLEHPDTGLIVFDSMAALTPKEEAADDMEKVQVALQARLNRKFMRKAQTTMLDSENTTDIPPTIIYINQLTTQIGGYGDPLVEGGGQALKYYPSLKVRLKRGDLYPSSKSVKDEGVEPKAQEIKFHFIKNKTAAPHRRGHVWFYFDTLDEFRRKGSYDRLEEIIRYAKKYEVVKPHGASTSMVDMPDPETGEVVTLKSSAALAKYLRENEKAKLWVEKEVMKRAVEEEEDDTDVEQSKQEQGESIPEIESNLGTELDFSSLD